MSQVAVKIIMGGAALGALAVLVSALKQARDAGDLDASAMLTLGMGWLISFPIALVVITGDLTRQLDAFRELVPVFPGWYLGGVRVAMILLAVLGAALLLTRLRSKRVPVHTAGLFAILLWAVAHLASGLHGGPLLSLSGGVLLVCLMAATVLPRGRGACLGAGIFGVTLAIASGALAAFRYENAVIACPPRCSVLGPSLTGVLPNENLLGAVLVAAIPFAYLGFRGRARTWLVLYLAGMAIVTGSRLAVLAGIISVAALLIVRPRLDANRRTPIRTLVAGLALAGAVFASVYVVQRDWDPYALTNRPALWSVASEYVKESPLFGYGPEKWASLYESSSEIPRVAEDSTHNQWIDVLFRSGWVGIALLVGIAVAAIWSAGYARPAILLTLAAIAMIGTTERVWAIGTVDLFSFTLVALILTGATRERTSVARSRPALQASA